MIYCIEYCHNVQGRIPLMTATSEKNYQLNYNGSYTGNLHHCDSIIDRAFESVLSQNYSLFILKIECIGVSIYPTDNGSYNINMTFKSHARGKYGRNLPTGTI